MVPAVQGQFPPQVVPPATDVPVAELGIVVGEHEAAHALPDEVGLAVPLDGRLHPGLDGHRTVFEQGRRNAVAGGVFAPVIDMEGKAVAPGHPARPSDLRVAAVAAAVTGHRSRAFVEVPSTDKTGRCRGRGGQGQKTNATETGLHMPGLQGVSHGTDPKAVHGTAGYVFSIEARIHGRR